jgi:hypothetical protein
MTNEEFQAKLAEAEDQIKYLTVFKDLYDARADGNTLIISMIAQYKCETCKLYHFPEPVKSCMHVEDGGSERNQTRR